ncbi:amidohydrolase [Nonomuraea sp. 3-1Str]|uniref:amidohydrolase n=1 Tax=Nonomuraea sp. 3-1Str TaxID=2929801 RepID=UPI0028605CC3|nr:amidohydrolase [Nonomuraea sp. 3-1Str]MDR8411180.1 amidohydrolase [Nonomuraea sp. 3-1Str]
MSGGKTSASRVLAELDTIRADLEDCYRDVHAHPELGHQERRTSAKVAGRLRACGYEVHEHVGGTGVVGVLVNGTGPGVLFRADMDALPIKERTGLPYASTATDGDGRPVMHACGHDMHVTCLLGAARLLAQVKDAWSGTFIALFQPAEEPGDGADRMIADGLTDRVPRPVVCLAQHVLPYPAGRVLTRPGPALSAADNYRVTLYGRSAHGSALDKGVDPVVMASMLVVRLQTVVSREVAPLSPAVLTVGSIHAGTNPNNIPESAEIQLNVRTSGAGRWTCRRPARTSARSRRRSACRSPTGASAAWIPPPSRPRPAGAPWPPTSRSTTAPPPHPSSSPPWTPASRPRWSPPSPTSAPNRSDVRGVAQESSLGCRFGARRARRTSRRAHPGST